MTAYRIPDAPDFEVRSVFLGAFFKWSSFENTRIAQEHGFEVDAAARTGTWEFADIDCDFIALHHFLKWHKFGMTRAFDTLSVQIRAGLTTRQEAVETIRRLGLQKPQADIAKFCAFVGEPVDWFDGVAERFRNPKIWLRDGNTWKIPGFLIEDWNWEQG